MQRVAIPYLDSAHVASRAAGARIMNARETDGGVRRAALHASRASQVDADVVHGGSSLGVFDVERSDHGVAGGRGDGRDDAASAHGLCGDGDLATAHRDLELRKQRSVSGKIDVDGRPLRNSPARR